MAKTELERELPLNEFHSSFISALISLLLLQQKILIGFSLSRGVIKRGVRETLFLKIIYLLKKLEGIKIQYTNQE